MKRLIVVGVSIILAMCGCGKKNEDYRDHETETFRNEKMETFKKLNEMRSVLSYSLWKEGEEKTSQAKCRKSLRKASNAVSNAGKISDNFSFACRNLPCKECKFHLMQEKMILVAYTHCIFLHAKDLPNIYVTESHRKEIENTLLSIENAIKALEKPELFVKDTKVNDKQK